MMMTQGVGGRNNENMSDTIKDVASKWFVVRKETDGAFIVFQLMMQLMDDNVPLMKNR